MKRYGKLIIPSVIAVIFLGIGFYFLNSLFGNPISALIAESRLKEYAAFTYPNLNLELSKARYNFKTQAYGCSAQSKQSEDTLFSIQYYHGQVFDDYEYEVENNFATYRRLSSIYDELVAKIIVNQYPHETSLIIGDLVGDTGQLTRDMPFEQADIPLDFALTVWIVSDKRDAGQMAALLWEMHEVMERNAVRVDKYCIRLEEPMAEDEKPGSGDNLYLEDFPVAEITADRQSLIERITVYIKI